jgi:surface polysaccharide O-acyltransferase-like enzyme
VPETAPANTRRADLDWIRVAALGLLILYHVMLVYAPWDWHVHSSHHYAWLGGAALVTNPWRLTLLFLVSGAAIRFMSRRRTAREVLVQRAARLLPPLAFGVLVLVPPQSWIEAMDKGSFSGSLDRWWLMEFGPAGLANGVPLNHLWFVVYIAAYSLVAIALLSQPRVLGWIEAGLARAFSGWRLLILPIVYLAVIRQTVYPWIGITNQIQHDWYNHLASLAAFLFGFVLAGRETVWSDLERYRRLALGAAAAALVCLVALELHPGGNAYNGLVKHVVFAVDQWATIAAILGFGSRHLRRADGPVLRYLNEAIFPCYLAHQTLLVIAAHLLVNHGAPAWVEAPILVLATLGGSLLVYELVRRVPVLRPWWGLKRLPKAPAPAPSVVWSNPAAATTPAGPTAEAA